jgi:hypothetical protein
LVRPGDGEVLAGGGEQAAAFELVLQRFDFRLGAFEDGVSLADRVGERFGPLSYGSVM